MIRQVTIAEALEFGREVGHDIEQKPVYELPLSTLQSPENGRSRDISEKDEIVSDDVSFLITRDSQTVAAVPACRQNGLICNFDGTSVIPYFRFDQPDPAIIEELTSWILASLADERCNAIKILAEGQFLETLLTIPLIKIESNTRVYGYYDLSIDSDSAYTLIRKRYKSYINKGRELKRTIYTSADQISITCFRHLLSKKLGYILNRKFLRKYLANMKAANARLFEYSLGGTIVGVVGISRWKKFSSEGDFFYDIGAYNKESPVPTHFCLYDALKYHHEEGLGRRVFLLHGVPVQRPNSQEKLSNIDFFKAGMCTHTFKRNYMIVSAQRTEWCNYV